MKVIERSEEDGKNEWIVGIEAIIGIVHLIPNADIPGQYWVNNRIDLKIFDKIN